MAFGQDPVRALVFDVFGTVVDWRGSIIAEGARFESTYGIRADWPPLADAWRAGYQPAMDAVRRGRRSWATIDQLHREILDGLLPRFGLDYLDEALRNELNHVWHRLTPWPDVKDALPRLRAQRIATTLSNGNMSLLIDLSRYAGLQWDCILSAELCGRYKPDPETYLMVGRLLDLPTSQLMMVASHTQDIVAAKDVGMQTAFVTRPLEYGPSGSPEVPPPSCDLVVSELREIADRLGS